MALTLEAEPPLATSFEELRAPSLTLQVCLVDQPLPLAVTPLSTSFLVLEKRSLGVIPSSPARSLTS